MVFRSKVDVLRVCHGLQCGVSVLRAGKQFYSYHELDLSWKALRFPTSSLSNSKPMSQRVRPGPGGDRFCAIVSLFGIILEAAFSAC